MRSAQTPSGSWTICEPQEVQLSHGYHRVPRVHTDSNRSPHGPSEGSCDPELARTTERLQCAIIPGIRELLPPLHHGLLTYDPPTDEFVQEGHTLEFWQEGNDCVPNFEEGVLHSPSTLPLGPGPLDDGGNRCV